ncbi:LysM peptidoglycan-binding domain-containing protein [Streptomyces sp. MUSC 14]|uniref:LysM peptidoglycan-binding domain-containing protein n=1 Tax=Streptomyces sp. MUSC 14 TaxID=1354889 RepID=UPI000D1B6DBD|nr:LysM peptidoglycan-binding domain-containing protein [Streptomyces sp. MUSC 14]
MAPRTPKPLRAAGALLRALTGLILLVALVGGVPLALLTIGHQPTELSGGPGLLLQQDDGTLWLVVLTLIGWAAWAAFTLSVVVEVVAVARRRSAPRIRGLGSMQSLASFLVGGIVLLAPTAASAATTTPAIAVTQTVNGHTAGATATPRATPTTKASYPTHTVTSATETPWDLAETYLGNGQRWKDIAALNPDVPGLASGDQYLPKAAVIKLPLDARTSTPASGDAAAGDTSETTASAGTRAQLSDRAPTAAGTSAHEDTAREGDSLSRIAQKEYGDGNAWPRLFEASRGKSQPHGLPEITNPDVIYPGQQITVPGAPSERHDPAQDTGRNGDRNAADSDSRPHTLPATPTPHHQQDQDQGHGEGTKPAPAPSQSQSSAPTSAAPSARPGQQQGVPPAASRPPASASPTASAAASAPSSSSPAATGSHAPTASASNPLQLRTVLGAGALLAAAITGALAVRRLLQRRRRTPGERIAMAPEISPAEAQLAAAAELAGATRLHLAVHTLAHLAGQDGAEVPVLRAARIGARTVDVLPEDLGQEPRAPFTAGEGGWWRLAADADLLDEDATREMPAPYPGLVTIGSTDSGELVLVNLGRVPAVLLDGEALHIAEVCTSLALELGMSPWATEIEVVTVGFGEDLPQLLPTCRIAHMRQPAHALRDLSERLLEAHQMPGSSHQPYLLLCAAELDADTAWQFADVIDRAGGVPVTLIAPAGSAGAHFPEAETVNASLSTPQPLGSIGLDIIVQRLERAAYEQIATALALSGQPAEPAQGPWRAVPDEPDLARQSDLAVAEEFDGLGSGPGRDCGSEAPAAEPVSGNLTDSDVFPALLAASTDPAGLRLLPATSDDGQDSPRPELAEGPAENEEPDVPASAIPEPDSGGGTADSEAHDLHAPEIRVLGPVEVEGVASSGHGPRIAQLATLMYFRPNRSADALCSDMDPLTPWGASTLNARLRGLRSALGNDPAGNPYVPRRRTGEDPYRLSPAVRCDWTRFLQLAERALPQGPAGLPDLEKALGLVRGRPFGSRPLPWAEPFQQEMITRIIDVAHTVATYRTPAGPHHSLSAARQAIATGLDVDDSSELLYRAWMRVENAAGNRSGLHTAIARIQQVNRSLEASMEMETEQLINELLHGRGPAMPKAL